MTENEEALALIDSANKAQNSNQSHPDNDEALALINKASNLEYNKTASQPEVPKENLDGLDKVAAFVDSISAKVDNGFLGGTMPYISGGIDALGRTLGVENASGKVKNVGYSSPTLDLDKLIDAYHKGYATEKASQDKTSEDHPILGTVAEIGGGFMNPLMSKLSLSPLGQAANRTSMLGKIATHAGNAAATGAAFGAIAPTSTGDLNIDERISNAKGGALVGGAIGGVLGTGGEILNKVKNEFPNLYRAGEVGYEDGKFIHAKSFATDLVEKFRAGVDGISTNVKEIGSSELAGRNKQIGTLQQNLTTYQNQIADIENELNAKIKDLYKESKLKNNLNINDLVNTETETATTKILKITDDVKSLAADNKKILGNVATDIESVKLQHIEAEKIHHAEGEENLNKIQPDEIKNTIQKTFIDLGKYFSKEYNGLESKFDKVAKLQSDNVFNKMRAEYRAQHGMPDAEMLATLKRNSEQAFKFNLGQGDENPLNMLVSKLQKIGLNTPENHATKTAVIEKISPYFDTDGSITLNNFRTLLNKSKNAEAVLSDIRNGVSKADSSQEYFKVLREFNDEMRAARNTSISKLDPAILAKVDPNLAENFQNLNAKYADFAQKRDVWGADALIKNAKITGEEAGTDLVSRIKQFGQNGEIGKASELYTDLSNSKNPQIKNLTNLLDEHQQSVKDAKELLTPQQNPYVTNLSNTIEKVDELSKIPRPTPEQVTDLLTYEHGGQIIPEDVNSILKNLSDMKHLEANPSNPNGILQIEEYKNNIRRLLKGEVPENIQNIPKDVADKFKKLQELGLNLDKETPLPNLTAEADIAAQNKRAAVEGQYFGEHREPTDVTLAKIKQLQEVPNNDILDKAIKSSSNPNSLEQTVQDLVEKGANPTALNLPASETDKLTQLLSQIKERLPVGVKSKVPAYEELQKLAQDLELANTDIRGTLNVKNLGFAKTAAPTAANVAGYLLNAGKTLPRTLIDAGSEILRLPKLPEIPSFNVNKLSTTNVANTIYNGKQSDTNPIDEYTKFKRFDSILKQSGTNINEFNSMDSTKRAAIINSLMQNSATREDAKRLEEYGNGRR